MHIKQQSKICPVCEKPFQNRKKWQSRGLWPQIIYCSERCRREREIKSVSKGKLGKR
ncbi:MAG: DUF2256 domain-containing protein [Acidiferrobacterales bacterium]|nr:DUF2256 domain-containing protein [Acidiferrobacterales bacterium]